MVVGTYIGSDVMAVEALGTKGVCLLSWQTGDGLWFEILINWTGFFISVVPLTLIFMEIVTIIMYWSTWLFEEFRWGGGFV